MKRSELDYTLAKELMVAALSKYTKEWMDNVVIT